MMIGIDPQTTAHGVKIEPMNITVVAIAEISGHSDGVGKTLR